MSTLIQLVGSFDL